MARDLSGSVVVVTGASSGVGRAAALEFAAAGCSVVLAARRGEALREAAAECERRGAQAAFAVPTDVRDVAAVEQLAATAVERLGRIDVWVNNAAVTMFGRFEDSPADLWREVMEVNFFGYVNGARAVLPHFRRRGAGTLINVGSVNSYVGFPYVSSYIASKHAIRGWAEALRAELRGEGIDVCTVLPGSIDTPLFQQGANYFGRAAKPLRPMLHPARVAAAIVRCAKRPRREVVVGMVGRQILLTHHLAPGLLERVAPKMLERDHFLEKAQPPTSGNLVDPLPEWTGVTGGWKDGDASPKGGPARGAARGVTTAAGATFAAGLALILTRR